MWQFVCDHPAFHHLFKLFSIISSLKVLIASRLLPVLALHYAGCHDQMHYAGAQVRLLASNKAGLDTHTHTHFLPMTVSLIPRIVSARSYPTLMLTFYDSAEERKGAYGQICCWWSTSVILRGLTCTRFCIWASRALCVMCGCIVNVHTLGCVGQCIL